MRIKLTLVVPFVAVALVASCSSDGPIGVTSSGLTWVDSYLSWQSSHPQSIVRSFTAPDGMNIDCYIAQQQPALWNPSGGYNAMAIQPFHATGPIADQMAQTTFTGGHDGQGRVQSCPAGTVPIRKLSAADLNVYPSQSMMVMKSHQGPGGIVDAPKVLNGNPQTGANNFYHGAYSTRKNDANGTVMPVASGKGLIARLTVWDPTVGGTPPVSPFEHSLGQVWIVGQATTSGNTTADLGLQTLEVGWNVDPGLYQNTSKPNVPRLFTFTTRADYYDFGYVDGYLYSAYNLTQGSPVVGAADNVMIGAPVFTSTPTNHYTLTIGWLYYPTSSQVSFPVWGLAEDLNVHPRSPFFAYIPASYFAAYGNHLLASGGATRYDVGGEIYTTHWPSSMYMGPGSTPPAPPPTWNNTGTGPTYEVASDIGEVVNAVSFDNWVLQSPGASNLYGIAENPFCWTQGYLDTTAPFDNTSNSYLVTQPPWFIFGGAGNNLGANPGCQ